MAHYRTPHLDYLLKNRRATGKDGKVFENTTGVSTANNIATLDSMLARYRPARTMEVGLAFAGSALLFARYHQLSGHPDGSHVAMDFLQWDIYKDGGLLNLESSGLMKWVDFRREKSALSLGDLIREGQRFDFVYIDGSHFFDEVLIDAYFSMRLLNSEGIVAFDDSAHPDVRKVLRYLDRNQSRTLRRLDLSPFHPQGESLRYRAAVALGKAQLTAYRLIGTTDRDWETRLHDF